MVEARLGGLEWGWFWVSIGIVEKKVEATI